jgi:hypothetical protein
MVPFAVIRSVPVTAPAPDVALVGTTVPEHDVVDEAAGPAEQVAVPTCWNASVPVTAESVVLVRTPDAHPDWVTDVSANTVSRAARQVPGSHTRRDLPAESGLT